VFDLPALRALLQRIAAAQLDSGRGRDGERVAVLGLAALRLRRDLHVRGRHAAGRARAQALRSTASLLRELLGQEELRDLLDGDAVDEVERQLRGDPRTPDELHDQLRPARRPARGEYDEGPRASRCSTSAAR
jgi:ATP-dependent Lhr-like helicase